jgi:DNA-binding HxlR family transcriptional regulator
MRRETMNKEEQKQDSIDLANKILELYGSGKIESNIKTSELTRMLKINPTKLNRTLGLLRKTGRVQWSVSNTVPKRKEVIVVSKKKMQPDEYIKQIELYGQHSVGRKLGSKNGASAENVNKLLKAIVSGEFDGAPIGKVSKKFKWTPAMTYYNLKRLYNGKKLERVRRNGKVGWVVLDETPFTLEELVIMGDPYKNARDKSKKRRVYHRNPIKKIITALPGNGAEIEGVKASVSEDKAQDDVTLMANPKAMATFLKEMKNL